MAKVCVQNRKCNLCGTDEEDLAQRVDHFRAALLERHGTIVDILWLPRSRSARPRASILYQIPTPRP